MMLYIVSVTPERITLKYRSNKCLNYIFLKNNNLESKNITHALFCFVVLSFHREKLPLANLLGVPVD